MADINAEMVDEGDESSWYLKLNSGDKSYIGRYGYPLGLPLRNSNIPLFHACPKLFKLTWDKGEYRPISSSSLHDNNDTDKLLADHSII